MKLQAAETFMPGKKIVVTRKMDFFLMYSINISQCFSIHTDHIW